MNTTNFKASDIQITAVYLQHGGDQLRFDSYPRRLVYKGREYALVEA